MRARLLFLPLLLLVFSASQAQRSGASNLLYFGFGTNRSWYGKSDITVHSSGPQSFDFTVQKARAKDDGGLKFDNGGAAQYSYQIGYYFTKKKWGLEFNFDHIKYFVRPGQTAHVTGTINGQKVDQDRVLDPSFFAFEHSDGGNYALFNFVKMRELVSSQNKKQILDLVLKLGAGPVIPKTNSTILGQHFDDIYKVSGYVAAAEAGLRFTFLKNLYVMPSFKGAYANYTDFAIYNGGGHQKWGSGHFEIILGGQIHL